MALHKRSDFAKLCGLSTGNLSNYIGRGKVLLSGDWIDDAIPQNASFLKKWQGKSTPASVVEPSQSVINTPPPEITGKSPVVASPDPAKVLQYDLENQIKKADLEKRQRENRLLQLKIDKLNGILIPTDLVKIVFTQHFKSVTTAFQQAADNLLMEIAKKADLSTNQVAELRGAYVNIINQAVNNSIDESTSHIDNIVFEYSEKLGRGEKK
jgi:hypothetical protein